VGRQPIWPVNSDGLVWFMVSVVVGVDEVLGSQLSSDAENSVS